MRPSVLIVIPDRAAGGVGFIIWSLPQRRDDNALLGDWDSHITTIWGSNQFRIDVMQWTSCVKYLHTILEKSRALFVMRVLFNKICYFYQLFAKLTLFLGVTHTGLSAFIPAGNLSLVWFWKVLYHGHHPNSIASTSGSLNLSTWILAMPLEMNQRSCLRLRGSLWNKALWLCQTHFMPRPFKLLQGIFLPYWACGHLEFITTNNRFGSGFQLSLTQLPNLPAISFPAHHDYNARRPGCCLTALRTALCFGPNTAVISASLWRMRFILCEVQPHRCAIFVSMLVCGNIVSKSLFSVIFLLYRD